jgi:hypothetical protein
MRRIAIFILSGVVTFAITFSSSAHRRLVSGLKAHATISGLPSSGISGTVTFTQKSTDENHRNLL